MINISKILISTIVIITMISCDKEVEDILQGTWSMDKIQYKDLDVFSCLNINVFSIKKNILDFPKYSCKELARDIENNQKDLIVETFKTNQGWKLKVYNSSNKIFEEELLIRFYKNEKEKLLMMELSSEDVSIIARRGFLNYDKNIARINRLVYLTNQEK